MGQHFASLREFFRMDGERQAAEICASALSQPLPLEMVNRDITESLSENETNGNVPVMNSNILPNRLECKLEGNLDNDRLNLDVDNHNSRFESLYSQPVEAQDTKQVCNNGNVTNESSFRQQQEACCSSSSSSNSSSSSEDSPINPPLRRSSKTLSFGKRKNKQRNKDQSPVCNHVLSSKKKRSNWVLKFNCAKSKSSKNTDIIPGQGSNNSDCDCDERARIQRAREMEEGVEPPPGYKPNYPTGIQVHPNGITVDSLAALFQAHAGIQAAALTALSQIDFTLIPNIERPAHTQVDYVHCLVPDLRSITACSFYWGKMDRYEAERLLEGKQEGTFLLRDSAQEEFLFSVSFRKYGRSLHARIEQWNHKFSFDSHDPGVYASETVCGLIEHYKDPSCCMFFEPMLTIPLHRNFAFPLQHLCRAVITTRTTYDGINKLQLPKTLKSYLKEYHYKQRVRVRRLDTESDLQTDCRSISCLPI
ncbi:suppressor of cytokine signaling 5-like isoform X3 [Nylanderia fulva]|uniref:suppressor of cytokine signaling 5-like isoform X3 n=1 Tax=Nylanderia fulva TaxID=613905 RepID=UPI0010FB3EAB|nr:suppressor of cytokine signaling 5-like isoform X3 [Nylanderia fulva]